MRPIFIRIAIATFALWQSLSALAAQTKPGSKPDFSGVWKMDRTRSESAMQEQPVGDITVVITQTDSMLKIETIRDRASEIAIYPIEARPSTPTEVTATRRAFWDGFVLVDEGAVDISGQTVGFREARTQTSAGDEMEVQTTVKIEHGYESKGAQTVVTGKNVFVRLH